jgi:hypothetical protein
MNLRKITSMTMLLSATILVINSLVLYVVPEGRVAYWANWTFWGLSKSQWGEQHTTVGFLFILASVLHIYYNWKPIVAYMKNKAREIKVFTGAFNVALALSLIFVVGTYYRIPPMSTIIELSDHFKVSASKKYGEPPYGHAELSSLKMFASKENLDLQKSVTLLRSAGINFVDEKQTINDIALQNSTSPQQIYLIIKAASLTPEVQTELTGPSAFMSAPKTGWGRRKIGDICEEYQLDLEKVLGGLAAKGINADQGDSLKKIAETNDTSPLQIYEMMVEIVSGDN